jgi:heterotetrameric sarcosine oxidase gamma subunit
VTDTRTLVEALEPAALIAFDLWSEPEVAAARIGEALGGALPGLTHSTPLPGGWRAIRVEPTVWWLSGPLADLDRQFAQLEAALGEDGAATDLSGGFTRLGVSGPAWREVLMIGGVFDAENPDFGAGSTAGTLLHHASVRHDVTAEDRVHIHVPPGHAEDLLHHLRTALTRLASSGNADA